MYREKSFRSNVGSCQRSREPHRRFSDRAFAVGAGQFEYKSLPRVSEIVDLLVGADFLNSHRALRKLHFKRSRCTELSIAKFIGDSFDHVTTTSMPTSMITAANQNEADAEFKTNIRTQRSLLEMIVMNSSTIR
jgi:hypothetical protein